ncbi:MAG TPA: hypothetical protein VHU91_05140 [Mycobacteriales bacterium]|jgi:hypothetical protein|nr:hypothetical protein [Mycobacteriales bacterium]
MTKRLFWLGVGAVAGVLVFRKLSAGRVSHDTAGSSRNASAGGLVSAVRGFLDDMRSAMNKREGELLAVLDRPAPTPEDVRAVMTESAYAPRHAAP